MNERGGAAIEVDQMEMLLGASGPDFRLPSTDGRTYALEDLAGAKGTVIVFICNHCPYVKALIGRLIADARALMAEGVGFAAISSNDAASYPEDSFPRMGEFAKKHDFPFPYLHDEAQDVARAYGAVCTPDSFGFDRDLNLKYRGRLDEGRTNARHGRRSAGARESGSVDRLLDQMEGGTRVGAPGRSQMPSREDSSPANRRRRAYPAHPGGARLNMSAMTPA